MKAQKKLKFKVGDHVVYVLQTKVLCSGIITKAEIKRGQKPYTILADDGGDFYANEEYLLPYKTQAL